mmetsp:Transcript_29247/g.37728  ORF Transcript_29247/g.37728 Transcript_29247/m.37728 type:complete len:291 (+) Transcript_29247:84-956(+)
MAPVQFDDISKSITNLFDRSGFGGDKKIKQTFKTAPVCGSAITVSEEIKGFDDFSKGFSGKISAKWKHASGFSIDKFENDAKKGTVIEASYPTGVDGLSASMGVKQQYNKNPNSYPIDVQYENDMVAAGVSTAAPDFKDITASCVLATDGLMVGSSVTYSNGGIGDYPISLSYTGPGYVAAVEASDELKCFNILGSYKASPDLTLATKFMIPDGAKESVSLVGVYKVGDEFNTKIAAKYSHTAGMKKNTPKTVEVAVTAKPLPKVEAGAALGFPLANVGSYNYGLTFTLG